MSPGRGAGPNRRRSGGRSVAALVRFAAAMSTRDAAGAARAVRRMRRLGWPRAAAEEAALMLILHAGFPAALEGFAVLASEWPGRARRATPATAAEWRRRGERNCRRVYGRSFERLVANVAGLHPDLCDLMLEIGYGRVLSRPRLDACARELVAVAVLAAQGWERQLVSHLLGATRLGATRGEALAAARAGVRAGGAAVRAAFDAARRTAFARGASSAGA